MNDKIRARVQKILTEYPKTRDDKNLFYRLYLAEYPATIVQFSSIDRAWRFIQRKDPKLRGKEFFVRQSKARKISRLYAEEKV